MSNSIYMEQIYNACFGVFIFDGKYAAGMFDTVCHLALRGIRINYTIIKKSLLTGIDKHIQLPLEKPLPTHEDIRGLQYY